MVTSSRERLRGIVAVILTKQEDRAEDKLAVSRMKRQARARAILRSSMGDHSKRRSWEKRRRKAPEVAES